MYKSYTSLSTQENLFLGYVVYIFLNRKLGVTLSNI